ncbi:MULTISPECIES: NlpC/P60 family protein [Streptomyces]|uniref:C40 family peptidase n=1 Tax=Streptomyces TaxID=1883 RepID=UPI0002E9D737|nr:MULTISPECIES: C40 family peptidase [Streptomyces]
MASCRRSPQSGSLIIRSGSLTIRSGPLTVLAAASAAVASVAALSAVPASAEPHDPASDTTAPHATAPHATPGAVERLYAQAERATERYNAAEAHTQGLRRQVDRLQDRVARGQERLNRMRVALGALAGGQYRSGGVDPGLALILSEDPANYLDKAATLQRIGKRQAGQLRVFDSAQRTLRQQRAEAAARLARLEHGRKVVIRHKRAVRHKLATARRLFNALPAAQRAAYLQSSPAMSRAVGSPEPPPSSPRAAAALEAARRAVGQPYAWGQAGPTAFDCSGLTQWAYGRAGVAIPRTSQQQASAGHPVSLSHIRPGDLVVYRSDAGHVGIYAGNGQVIHAPHPGARVRYDPVGMMPISAITRV